MRKNHPMREPSLVYRTPTALATLSLDHQSHPGHDDSKNMGVQKTPKRQNSKIFNIPMKMFCFCGNDLCGYMYVNIYIYTYCHQKQFRLCTNISHKVFDSWNMFPERFTSSETSNWDSAPSVTNGVPPGILSNQGFMSHQQQLTTISRSSS